MVGGDLEGAYVVTRANPDYPVYIKTPQGYSILKNMCIQAIGNLYGFPPAGQNFSIHHTALHYTHCLAPYDSHTRHC